MYTAEVLKLPDGSLAPGEKKRLRKRYIAQKRAERALNKDEINIEELAVALWEMYHEEGTEVTHCERSGETMSVPSAKGDEQTVEEETGPFAVRSSAEKEREEVITIAEATVSASEPLMEIGPVAKNNESTVHKLIKFAGFRYGDSKSGNNVYVQVKRTFIFTPRWIL